MKNIRVQKGFTLIEMVIVVALLGILSSIAIVQYGEVQKKARENADYTNASNIAIATYMAINDGNLKSENINSADVLKNLKDGGYLASIPSPQSEEGNFSVSVSGPESKDVKVLVGEKVFYPKQNSNSTEEKVGSIKTDRNIGKILKTSA